MPENRPSYLPSEVNWDSALKLYGERDLGHRVGFGERPGVLVVDMQNAFLDPAYELGSDPGDLVDQIATVLDAARAKNVPVFYAKTFYREDLQDAGIWGKKIPALRNLTEGSKGAEIHPGLTPKDSDFIVPKKRGSSFFQTNLEALMVHMNVDTLIITGVSTSGCIRAAAIDASSHGYRVIVPAEAVGDRAAVPHAANLFDIDAKYGDVVNIGEVIHYLDGLPATR